MGQYKKHETTGPMITALNRGDVDFGGTPATLTQLRLDQGACVSQYYPFRTCFMFLTSYESGVQFNEFIRPFAPDSWYATLVFIIIGTLILSMIIRLQPNTDRSNDYGLSFILIISALAQQGSEYFPGFLSTRFALLNLAFCGLMVFNYYSASLVSARLSEPLQTINDSLNELSKLDFKFASERSPYFTYLLYNHGWEGDQFIKRRWEHIPESEKFIPPVEGIQKILSGEYAYHSDPVRMYNFITKYKTNCKKCIFMTKGHHV